MPVNYQQALDQIRKMGKQAPEQEERMKRLREEAARLFVQYAAELDTLQQLVERAVSYNAKLRCAVPFEEALNKTTPLPELESSYTLFAADGSQIDPDRHAAVEFGAINVGIIRLHPGCGETPQEHVVSKLMFYDELHTANGGLLGEDVVALMRDMAERQELATLAQSEEPPVLTLTDGPLELFREGQGMPEFDKKAEEYRGVLETLADLGAATAGYVDKPRGDLLIRLLELVHLEQNDKLKEAGKLRPFQGISDAALFAGLLQPGERSAVFGIQSTTDVIFQGRLGLHFFYLNVGRAGHPYLSRVEIPKWVAENERLMTLLHASLVAQSAQVGVRAYPYILHRAHEIALITYSEREQLESMILAELRRQGVTVGEQSNKQFLKERRYS